MLRGYKVMWRHRDGSLRPVAVSTNIMRYAPDRQYHSDTPFFMFKHKAMAEGFAERQNRLMEVIPVLYDDVHLFPSHYYDGNALMALGKHSYFWQHVREHEGLAPLIYNEQFWHFPKELTYIVPAIGTVLACTFEIDLERLGEL